MQSAPAWHVQCQFRGAEEFLDAHDNAFPRIHLLLRLRQQLANLSEDASKCTPICFVAFVENYTSVDEHRR
jgi:hypothetical protein